MTQALFVLTNLVAIGWGGLLYRGSIGRPIWERLGVAALPFLGGTVVWHWVVSIAFQSMASFWNGMRLAPAIGLLHGYRLYYPATEGPINGWIYGPISAVAYLPAALLSNAGGQLLVARGLSLVYYHGPAAWLLLRSDEGRKGWPGLGEVLLFLTFVLLATNSHGLRYSATEVHADAPTLALAALAVALMVRGGGGRNPRTCSLALILAVLAVWSKQLTIPLLLVVLPAYALATGALKNPFRSLLPGIVGGLAITLVLFYVFDPTSLLLNIVVVPGRHRFRAKTLVDFLYPLVVLQEKHAPLFFLFAVGGLARIALPSAGGERRDRGWILFLIAGLAELPFSIMGYFGEGGNENSMSFSFYFLTLGTLLMLKPLVGSGRETEPRPTYGVWYLVIGLSLMLATFEVETLGNALIHRKGAWQDSVVAERFIRAHPGEVYFPCNPEAHLAAEGMLYHTEDGINGRAYSGIMTSSDHFFRHIPPRTRLVCYPQNAAGQARVGAMTYLKDFHKTDLAELPNWACFERDSGATR
ncbi:hypothetical protein SAMN05444166_5376 [Singulisphaera sp. GP187]|uniref:hypothetical protein n=1 Tax=Singulisphaera sp. GP187 TaxID=1882752 RepID=UPI00092CCAA7|nr:hypothetical protein [Singulisphaera sp. GP187]SIO57301.1 hypothetical protein SAMN05444166_5376 [Singulisphaera sp. GP187]